MRPLCEGSSTTISTSRGRLPESAAVQPASSEASNALSRACKRRSTSFNRLIPATGQQSFTTRTFPREQCASPSSLRSVTNGSSRSSCSTTQRSTGPWEVGKSARALAEAELAHVEARNVHVHLHPESLLAHDRGQLHAVF